MTRDEAFIPKQKPKKLADPILTPVQPVQRKRYPVKQTDVPNASKPQKSTKRKRNLGIDGLPIIAQSMRVTPESSSLDTDEYRALRRKYLLLEDESFSVNSELSTVEAGVRALKDEKAALLDQLVVLEGLVDPAEVQTKGKL